MLLPASPPAVHTGYPLPDVAFLQHARVLEALGLAEVLQCHEIATVVCQGVGRELPHVSQVSEECLNGLFEVGVARIRAAHDGLSPHRLVAGVAGSAR
jgi:hypothetical protein